MRLLITRPQPGADHSAEILRARSHEVVVAPLLQIEPLPGADLGAPPWGAVLLSSANAARAIARHPRLREIASLPVLAVGDSTAEAARAAGFADVQSSGGDARDLGRAVSARFAGLRAPLLYLAGQDRARDLAGDLTGDVGGLILRTVVVYRAVKAATFPPPVQSALSAGRFDGVLHFSLRTAVAYMDCAQSAGLRDKALVPLQFCLSSRVAGPLAGAENIRIAARPDETALLDLVGR